MCEMPAAAERGDRIPKGAKIQWSVIALAAVCTALAAVLAPGGGARPDKREPAGPERVFFSDIARQHAESRRLVANSAGLRLGMLARRVESADRAALGAPTTAPVTATPARDERVLRGALRKHLDADSVIARVELATGTSPGAARAAARLLSESLSLHRALL